MVESTEPVADVSHARSARLAILIPLSLALLGWAVYINSLTNPFVYDDYRLIVENGALRRPNDLWGVIWHDVMRPLVNLSYALDAAIWGIRPLGFHITNVVLHAINVALVFIVARALGSDTRPRQDGWVLPCFAAAMFAVHPMLSQAVGYVSARADVLCGTFVLLAFLAARRFLMRGGAAWLMAALLCWLLALGAKEVGAMLPLALLAYLLLAAPASGDARRRGVLLCVPMLLLVAAAALVRVWLLLKVEYASPGLDSRLVLVALDAFRGYLRLLLWPSGQTIFHSLAVPGGLMDLQVVLSFIVLTLAAVTAWLLRKVDRLVPFGFVWFVLFLIPSSALFVLGRGEALAEHRVYLSSIGIFLGAAAVLRVLVLRVTADAPALRTVLVALAAVFVLQLSARTLVRNAVWADPVRLWQESIAKAPDHWLPHLMLAEALRQTQGCSASEAEYRTSIQLRPEAAFAYTKLGGCLIEQRRFADASSVFGELARTAPQSAEGPSGLALVSMMEHGPDSARPYLLEAIRRDGSAVLPRQMLAGLEEERSDPAAALRLCQEIKTLAPTTPGNDECIRRNQQRLDSPHATGH